MWPHGTHRWEEHIEDIIGTGPENSPANSRKASACYDIQHLAVSDSLISAIPKLKALSWGLPHIPLSGNQLTNRSDHDQHVLFANAELFSSVRFLCHQAREWLHQNRGWVEGKRFKLHGLSLLI
ncbi:hypothetical protein N431DRAFT_427429 [Stipitochalara longipes BDJ]|nr:hypothetical protein N431DRAFT_427429 [Stipitochalara longipes BDJ]